MNSYFIRHTESLAVEEECLKKLWDRDKVCIHFPDRADGEKGKDNASVDPEDYVNTKERRARTAMNILSRLAKSGGYVWTESYVCDRAKIGMVKPQTIWLEYSTWTYAEEYEEREGTPAILKTLQLSYPRLVEPFELVGLRASRPRQGALCNWKAAGDRLGDAVENREPRRVWENLSTAQQEAVCAEYLRLCYGAHPRLGSLLLPVGRTLKDIDIYGLDERGEKLFAQVTYHTRESGACEKKLESLNAYSGGGASLVFFCREVEYGEEDGVFFVPVDGDPPSVENWLIKSSDGYGEALFSS